MVLYQMGTDHLRAWYFLKRHFFPLAFDFYFYGLQVSHVTGHRGEGVGGQNCRTFDLIVILEMIQSNP